MLTLVWQMQHNGQAAAGIALRRHCAGVTFDRAPGDRQAEAMPDDGLIFKQPREWVEYPFDLLSGNKRTDIRYGYVETPIRRNFRRHGYGRFLT